MTRAIWLVKCVGANELRAFRRKGISDSVTVENEQRWLLDWTTIVQSFIQNTLEQNVVAKDITYMWVSTSSLQV